jgi:SagB-type dehydrogenase family enzyme
VSVEIDLGCYTTRWREYHEATKHSPESLRRNEHFLNWANMPSPFRHYEGVPLVDLPADPPAPAADALDVLKGQGGTRGVQDPLEFLSSLLFYSASISAAKETPSGYRYALRVNPSSGNLHPTEFHFACPDGLYHYRVSSHMLEQRAAGNYGQLQFLLTTVAWREAWKYRSRAYRYCLHDIGHAWQALALAARALGCEAQAIGNFEDDRLATLYGLAGDEWPMLQVKIQGAPEFPAAEDEKWFGGFPNRLSDATISYPLIEEIHAATKKTSHPLHGSPSVFTPVAAGAPASGQLPFREVARRRRSALDFRGGDDTISLEQLMTLLDLGTRPLDCDFAAERYAQLYLYVHRVRGLDPGVYRYWPNGTRLEPLKSGDQRVVAAALSLRQNLAGNACVAFSMIGDLERATQYFGDRGYRYVHFEAGAIGQRLYLAAEALGFQSTGIGAFFDDSVHNYLDLDPGSGKQVVYHFASGYAVEDDRLVAHDRDVSPA